jgi:Nucleotidyl transferase AbiEii toxin, Type IV TA system
MTAAGVSGDRYRIELDVADSDQQTLLFWYPSATTPANDYIRSAVKIEGGAKSALDPHAGSAVKPYADDDLPDIDLTIGGITAVDPTRTFWDKVVILHGLRRWFDHRGQLRHGGQRVSRHYYDVFRLLQSQTGQSAARDRQLAQDCARHARMFFNTPDFDLNEAAHGTWTLAPTAPMIDALERDYNAMAGTIMGPKPTFAEVVEAVATLEQRINAAT